MFVYVARSTRAGGELLPVGEAGGSNPNAAMPSLAPQREVVRPPSLPEQGSTSQRHGGGAQRSWDSWQAEALLRASSDHWSNRDHWSKKLTTGQKPLRQTCPAPPERDSEWEDSAPLGWRGGRPVPPGKADHPPPPGSPGHPRLPRASARPRHPHAPHDARAGRACDSDSVRAPPGQGGSAT